MFKQQVGRSIKPEQRDPNDQRSMQPAVALNSKEALHSISVPTYSSDAFSTPLDL